MLLASVPLTALINNRITFRDAVKNNCLQITDSIDGDGLDRDILPG